MIKDAINKFVTECHFNTLTFGHHVQEIVLSTEAFNAAIGEIIRSEITITVYAQTSTEPLSYFLLNGVKICKGK